MVDVLINELLTLCSHRVLAANPISTVFKFHNPELGEFLCPQSLGLLDAPQSFLAPKSIGRLCVDLLTGLLPEAEGSYFFGRWNGYAIKTEQKRAAALARENLSTDISIMVLNSLRAIPAYRKLVPNPNLVVPIPCQLMLLKHGCWRYLEDDGEQVPMDSLKVLYAFAGWTIPENKGERNALASKFFSDLGRRLTKCSTPVEKACWIERQGEKTVRSSAGLQRVMDGVSAVDITVNWSGGESAYVLRLDAHKGSCLAEFASGIGLRYQHRRAVPTPFWG